MIDVSIVQYISLTGAGVDVVASLYSESNVE